jgi:hypothetical protein
VVQRVREAGPGLHRLALGELQYLLFERRVLRPGGKLLFSSTSAPTAHDEHASEEWLMPFWRRVAANYHPNRASLVLLGEPGFAVQETRRISIGPRLERPIVAGIASRR